MRFIRFDRWGHPLPDVIPSTATLTRDVDGNDTLELTIPDAGTAPGKGDRLLIRVDDAWREYVVTSPAASRSTGRPAATIVAQGAVNELSARIVDDYDASGRPAGVVLARILQGTRWTAGTVTGGAASVSKLPFKHVTALAALQSMCAAFGLECVPSLTVDANGVTGRRIDLVASQGRADVAHRFTYSYDLVSVKRTVDASDVVTRMYGYGKGTDDAPQGTVGRQTFIAINGGVPYVEDTDATRRWGIPGPDGTPIPSDGMFIDGDCDDAATLLAETRSALAAASTPRVSYEAEVADIGGARLGDRVQIVDTTFNPALRLEARVLKVEQDLLNPHADKLTLGNIVDSWTKRQAAATAALDKVSSSASAWSAPAGMDSQWLADLIAGSNNGMAADAAFCAASIDLDESTAVTPDPTLRTYSTRIDYQEGNAGSFTVAADAHGVTVGVSGWYLLTGTVNAMRVKDTAGAQDGGDFRYGVKHVTGETGSLCGGLFIRFEESEHPVNTWGSIPMPTGAAYLRAGETVFVTCDNTDSLRYGSLNRLQLFRLPFGNIRDGYDK